MIYVMSTTSLNKERTPLSFTGDTGLNLYRYESFLFLLELPELISTDLYPFLL